MLPSSFISSGLRVWEVMSFEKFQDGHPGGHFGHRNRTNLAILNLCVTVMPPIKFQLNQRRRCRLKNFKMATPGSHLGYRNGTILAILNLCVTVMPPIRSIGLGVWEEMPFEEFQAGHHGGYLGYQNRMILAILTLHVATPTKFQLNPTYGSGGDAENVKS